VAWASGSLPVVIPETRANKFAHATTNGMHFCTNGPVTETAGLNAASAAFPAGFQASRFTAGPRAPMSRLPHRARFSGLTDAMGKRVETRCIDEKEDSTN